MTAVSRAAATAQHLLLLGTLERGPVPLDSGKITQATDAKFSVAHAPGTFQEA